MIKFLDLQQINLAHQQEIEEKLLQTFRSGWYLLGNEAKAFEEQLAKFDNQKVGNSFVEDDSTNDVKDDSSTGETSQEENNDNKTE